MLEAPGYPAISRVMRVQPRADEQPASGFSWGDYEDVAAASSSNAPVSSSSAPITTEESADGEGDEEDDENFGWGVVKGRGRSTSMCCA